MTTSEARIVTTSWDDGDPADLNIAELLQSLAIAGTFYVVSNGCGNRKRLTKSELRTLASAGFEIGAHTVSHKTLTALNKTDLEYEVQVCKEALEQELGRQVLMFCYPNGKYNSETVRTVKAAGYLGARTVKMLHNNAPFSPFEMPTSVQAFPHRKVTYLKNQLRAKSTAGLTTYVTRLSRCRSWVHLGKQMFDRVMDEGGTWHLYGHSWEIQELGNVDEVREMLQYVSNRAGVTYATNGQVVSMYHYPHRERCAQPLEVSKVTR